jgi:nucleotide-binding universal stress UspA family protein
MYERILIPLDGSERAESILIRLRPILAAFASELIVLTSIDSSVLEEGAESAHLRNEQDAAWAYVNNTVESLSEQGFRVRGMVTTGPAELDILSAVESEDVSLVAMASHGRSGLSRLAFGSTTERVLRESPAPVLAVKVTAPDRRVDDALVEAPVEELSWKHILVPLDGSEASEAILEDAVVLARTHNADLHLCYCEMPVMDYGFADGSVTPMTDLDYMRGYLDEKVLAVKQGEVYADAIILKGHPASAITRHAEEYGIDLVAMTTHGRTGAARWLMGSVAESVLRHVHVPVYLKRSR